MPSYHLRCSLVNLTEVQDFIKLNSTRYLTCREEADETVNRTHIHSHLIISMKPQSFRNKLLTAFPELKGTKDYSFVEARDEDGMDRYICKGTSLQDMPIIVQKYGLRYTDEYILQAHRDYWEINKSLKKKEKVDKLNMTEDAVKRCRSNKINWDNRDEITKIWVEILKENHKGVDVNNCRRVIRGIMCELCPDDKYKERMLSDIWY